jgi:hypothetical protein
MSDSETTIIPVLKPRQNFNRDRKINTLLQYQVRHLLDVEHKQLTASHRTGTTLNPTPMSEKEFDKYLKSWTEGQAAKYIEQMTAKLHEIHPSREEQTQTMAVAKQVSPATKRAKNKVQAKARHEKKSSSKKTSKAKSNAKPKSKSRST